MIDINYFKYILLIYVYVCRNVRQKRPDRAVYVPRHRRSLEMEDKKSQSLKVSHTTLNGDSIINNNSKLQDVCCSQQNVDDLTSHNQLSESCNTKLEAKHFLRNISKNVVSLGSSKISDTLDNTEHMYKFSEQLKDVPILSKEKETVAINNLDENSTNFNLLEPSNQIEINDKQLEKIQEIVNEDQSSIEYLNCSDVNDHKDRQLIEQSVVSDVLIISDTIQKKAKQSELSPILVTPPEKKVKKIERQKSKPVPPPSPPLKMNRDECDWDSLFDDNGDCLDPTLIEEVSYVFKFSSLSRSLFCCI